MTVRVIAYSVFEKLKTYNMIYNLYVRCKCVKLFQKCNYDTVEQEWPTCDMRVFCGTFDVIQWNTNVG